MKALTLTSFGGLDALELADVPGTAPGEGEVVVNVRAVALGPWDLRATQGYFSAMGGSTVFPQVQGWDFAGETADGRRVLGFVAQPWMGVGSLAERLVVPAGVLAELPDGLDWAAASALPVCVLTAHLLVDGTGASDGDHLLVTGAAGMVGGFAVELARAQRANVIGAVRQSDAEEARRLGVETTVSTGEDLASSVRAAWPEGADACMDTLGLATAALECVRDRGRFFTTVPEAVPEATRGVAPQGVQVQPDPETLGALARRAARGELTVRVAEALPWEEFRRGYELLGRGGLHGKVVLTL
ncbi:MAG TPA: NADP-dependent oxidoreductase [Acidimicrobiales bacterium]|nr:NADP-dependent oxidoreductase [Acidimicrobiales bacterium]